VSLSPTIRIGHTNHTKNYFPAVSNPDSYPLSFAAIDGDGSIDPIDLYSMDAYLQEQDIVDDLGNYLVVEMQSVVDVIQGGRIQCGLRRYVDRHPEQAS
jgi:hypothetical protein